MEANRLTDGVAHRQERLPNPLARKVLRVCARAIGVRPPTWKLVAPLKRKHRHPRLEWLHTAVDWCERFRPFMMDRIARKSKSPYSLAAAHLARPVHLGEPIAGQAIVQSDGPIQGLKQRRVPGVESNHLEQVVLLIARQNCPRRGLVADEATDCTDEAVFESFKFHSHALGELKTTGPCAVSRWEHFPSPGSTRCACIRKAKPRDERLLLDSCQQVRRRDTQAASQFHDRAKARITFRTFKQTDLGPVKISAIAELFLREALRFARGPEIVGELLSGSHPNDAVGM